MNWINARLTALSELVLAPVASWSPQVVLVAISVVCGIAMTVVFRYTSNQRALRRVASRTKAHLLCLRIFKDDLGVAIRCQRDLLKAIGLRLWHSLPPMAVLILPFVFILTQLALRYEKRPLQPGDQVITALRLSPAHWNEFKNTIPQVPAEVTVETPPLRDAAEHAVYWRLRLDEPTEGLLRWNVGSWVVEKSLVATDDPRRLCTVSARRPSHRFLDRLLQPGEPGFDADSPVEAIDVFYPHRSTPFFGVDIPWWATFLILSMVTALCVRPFLKVQF